MKLLRIKLPDSLHARLKVQAAMSGSSMQEMAEGAIKHRVAVAEGFQEQERIINPALASSNPQKRGV